MSRRGKITQQENGKWAFVVDIAPKGAPRRQMRRRGFRTKTAAQEELTKVLGGVNGGTFVAPDKLTVGEWVERWLAGLEVAGKRATTISSYRERLGLHIVPTLGAVRLQAVAVHHLDAIYAELLKSGRRDGKGGLSPASVRYTHAICHSMFDAARRKKLIAHNPAQDATVPSAKSAQAPEMTVWAPAELRQFLDFVADDPLMPLFRLAAMTGMRRGEVLGLHRDDLDLDKGRVRIRHQLVSVDHVPTLVHHTKSDAGKRTIDLDAETVAVLRRHLARQAEIRLAVGPGYRDDSFVFAGPEGGHLRPESVSAMFERRVANSGLPKVRFHDLRHTHASHLLAAGTNIKATSHRLGHAKVSITLDVYSHLMPEDDSVAASAVAALVDVR